MHALVIEDEPLIAASIEAELRDLGYTSTAVVFSEAEAVASAARQVPDFITVDDKLDAGSGTGAVLRICADKAIPVVIITGNPFEVALPDVVTLGKPFSTAAFRAAWQRAQRTARSFS
jgi:DNA-binding response OmpR family regulator